MPMEVFDAPPIAPGQPPDPDAKPPRPPLDMLSILGKNAKEAASRTAGLALGTRAPESLTEFGVQSMAQAAPIKGAGMAALKYLTQLPRLAPAAARTAVASGQAGLRAASEGRDVKGDAALGAFGAAVAEGVLGLTGKALTRAAKAFDAIADRIRANPNINAGASLRDLKKLLEWWKADPSKAVQAVRADKIKDALHFADPSGESSRIFAEEIARGAHLGKVGLPATSVKASQDVRAGLPNVTAAADAAASHQYPALGLGALASKVVPGWVGHMIPRSMRPRALDSEE